MLTKSDYLRYLQCKKYLWLYKNRKGLLSEKVDQGLEKIYEAGFEVERYAYKLYPGGVSANVEGDFQSVISETKKLMQQKTPVIFQATVSGAQLFCRADIITYEAATDTWDIIEVKSTTEPKDIHYDDISFQKICFEDAGYKVGNVFLIHINNQYVKEGSIVACELLTVIDVTAEVREKIDETKSEIKNALSVLTIKDEPGIRVLRQCDTPYDCPFVHYCHKDFPEHSIYSIAGALGHKRLEQLLDEGVLEVKDIPEDILTNDKLIRHHHAVKHDLVHIDKYEIAAELENIIYPLYYLDYETFGPAIPIIDGYRPYQRVVFQYSLHIQESPNTELQHHYFLAKDSSDPTRAMSQSLKELIGPDGTVIAWNMSFEKGCNEEMGERAPEYALFYQDVNTRMYDLMQVFKKGHYVHKDFHGSASLKKVLPVVAPELSYKELGIQEGMTASNSWGDMVSGKLLNEESEKIYQDLLAYCELDTLAMVRILEKLNDI